MSVLSDHSDMPMDDAPEDLMDGLPDPTLIPETDIVRRLQEMAAELVGVDKQLSDLDEQIKVLKDRKYKLESRELPELFDQCMTDSIGVPTMGATVSLDTRYHANIKADWPEEQRQAGFAALDGIGGGDIVRVSLGIHFARGELSKAREVIAHLRGWNEFGNRPIDVSQNVPWNTLTAFVKEQHQRGAVIPMEALGATVGRFAKITERRK